VRHEDPGNAALSGRDDGLDVRGIIRPRIDDSDLGLPDQVGVGARAGEWPGVGRDDALDCRSYGLRATGREVIAQGTGSDGLPKNLS
jgi:hypothetical protein